MRKILSIFAAILFAGNLLATPSTNWTEIVFVTASTAAELDDSTRFSRGVDFYVETRDANDKMSVDKNTARFGNPKDSTSYFYRLKGGGKSTAQTTYLVANIPATGLLRIAARNSSSSEARALVVTHNETQLYNWDVQEADTISVDGNRYYPYIYVRVPAGEVKISFPDGGINFYSFAFCANSETPEYYVVGTMSEWELDDDYKMEVNPANSSEYMLDVDLDPNSRFKVVKTYNTGSIKAYGTEWYPADNPYSEVYTPNNYGDNGEITEAGEYTVYFRPDGQGASDWFYGYIYVTPKVEPEPVSCADVYQMAKNDVVDILNDVVVTFANGQNVWVRDETASLLIYLPAAGSFAAGDILSGVAGTVDIYNGVYEIKPSAEQVEAIVATAGEAPAAIPDNTIEKSDANKYIVMQGVEAVGVFAEGTQSNLTINGVTVRNQFKNGYTFEAGKLYDIYGVVTIYNNKPQVYFITAQEIGDVPPTPDYYVVGTMNTWTASENYLLTVNPANTAEYMGNFTFAIGDEIKVIGVAGEITTWYPDGTNNNYQITQEGEYTIYFRPDGQGGQDWFYGCIYADYHAPVETVTCAQIYQMAKNAVVDLLNDVVVTYANGKNVWVRDETASMLIYLPANASFAAGDVLSGIAGTVDIYNGVYEIKPSAEQVEAIVAAPGEAPAAIPVTTVTVDDMNKYIVMQGVQVEGAFPEGSQANLTINGVTVRNQFKNGYTFESGKSYNIYGVVTIYQNNPQVYFIKAEEAAASGMDNTNAELKAVKVVRDGQLFIEMNGVRYNAQGTIVR